MPLTTVFHTYTSSETVVDLQCFDGFKPDRVRDVQGRSRDSRPTSMSKLEKRMLPKFVPPSKPANFVHRKDYFLLPAMRPRRSPAS